MRGQLKGRILRSRLPEERDGARVDVATAATSTRASRDEWLSYRGIVLGSNLGKMYERGLLGDDRSGRLGTGS